MKSYEIINNIINYALQNIICSIIYLYIISIIRLYRVLDLGQIFDTAFLSQGENFSIEKIRLSKRVKSLNLRLAIQNVR